MHLSPLDLQILELGLRLFLSLIVSVVKVVLGLIVRLGFLILQSLHVLLVLVRLFRQPTLILLH